VQVVSLSKTAQVRQAIILKILTGQLVPGQRLVEAKIASELNVSQATVNAALQDLNNQRLVTKLMNRSNNVCRYTRAEIENLFQVRMALEPLAAEAASANWSNSAHAILGEQVDHMRRAARAKDLQKFCLADYTFHQELYKLTNNSFLIQACQAIAAAPFAYILCDGLKPLPTDYLALAEDHQDIVRALEEGPETAARITRERLMEWRVYSLQALEPGSVPTATNTVANKGNKGDL